MASLRRRVVSLACALTLAFSMVPATALASVSPGNTATGGGAEQLQEIEPTVETVTLQTAAESLRELSLLSTSSDSILIDGTAVDYVDRVNFSGDYAKVKNFYNALVEATDNDGEKDYLIGDEYYSVTEGTNATSGSYNAGDYCVVDTSDGKHTCIVAASFSYNVNNEDASFDSRAGLYQPYVYAALAAFDCDHPEVFWLNNSKSILSWGSYYPSTGDGTGYIAVCIDGTRSTSYTSENAIKSDITAVDNQVASIKNGAPEGASVYETLRYYNEWLTHNNEYNTDLESADANYPEAWECVSALKGCEGTTGPVCEGYSRALKVLCDNTLVDGSKIPCVLVSGHACKESGVTGEAHMWNYVAIDNVWYAIDATWNDPRYSINNVVQTGKESGGESEKWFLLGSGSVVADNWTFIQSHPAENTSFSGIPGFTNGPTLSAAVYSASASSGEQTGSETGGDAEAATLADCTVEGFLSATYGDTLCDVDLSGLSMKTPDGKTVSGTFSWESPSLVISSAGTASYEVTFTSSDTSLTGSVAKTVSIEVAKKQLTVAPGVVADKVYDGTAEATFSTKPTLEGVLDTDAVSLTATATFTDGNGNADKNVGTSKTVKISYSISNDNYILAETSATAQASINKQTLIIESGTLLDRDYVAGDVSASFSEPYSVSGAYGGDNVLVTCDATFADDQPGENKPVTVKYTLAGDDADNYQLSKTEETLYATITGSASQAKAPLLAEWNKQALLQIDGTYCLSNSNLGMMGWKVEDGAEEVTFHCQVFKVESDGTATAVSGGVNQAGLKGKLFYSDPSFIDASDTLESGTYYFQVTALGDRETTSDSVPVKSGNFTYTKPETSLATPAITGFGNEELAVYFTDANDVDSEWCYTLDLAYSATEDGDKETIFTFLNNTSTVRNDSHVAKTTGDGQLVYYYDVSDALKKGMQERGTQGCYWARMRVLTSNINTVSNSIVSEYVKVYSPQEVISDVSSKLAQVLETLSKNPSSADTVAGPVKDIGPNSLGLAMGDDEEGVDGSGVVSLVDKIEGYKNDVSVDVVNPEGYTAVPADKIDIVGAKLNVEDNTSQITLTVGEPSEAKPIDSAYNAETAVQFSMTPTGLASTENLAIPIWLKLPIPSGMNPSKVSVLHYENGSATPTVVDHKLITETKDGVSSYFATFVLTGFSDFAIVEMADEGSSTGGTTGGGTTTGGGSTGGATGDAGSIGGGGAAGGATDQPAEAHASEFALVDGAWHYFDESGKDTGAVTATAGADLIVEKGGAVYCLKADNTFAASEWVEADGATYYFADDGKATTGWATIDGARYHFGADGQMQTGLQEIGGSTYYLGEDGKMSTGLQQIEGKTYYFAEDGRMSTGEVTVDGVTYTFGEDGACTSQTPAAEPAAGEIVDPATGTPAVAAPLAKTSITKAKVAVASSKAYTGKALKPAVKVTYGKKTLRAGTDYTVTYRNNKKVGTATVTVKGRGAYTGTVTKTFKIVPKTVKVTKLTKAKKGFTVKWKKATGSAAKQTTGYQVRWSTAKSMKGAKAKTIKSSKTTSLKVTKLKANKKYYVQVRTYKKVGGKTYYSAWSAPKAVTTKK